MRCRVVLADAEHLNVVVLETVPAVTEVAGLLGAARCGVFRIEIQNNPLTFQIGKLHRLTVLVGESEIRCRISDLQSHSRHQHWVAQA